MMGYGLLTPSGDNDSFSFFEGIDKLIHLGLFFGFSMLLTLSFKWEWKLKLPGRTYITLLIAVGIAAMTEWIQSSIPSRSMDLMDFLFDCGGVALAVVLHYMLEKRNQTLLN